MQRLTPEQFFKLHFGFWSDEVKWELTPQQVCTFAEAYAEHLEASAWNDIDEMPPVDPESDEGNHSIRILIEAPHQIVEGFVDMENDYWFSETGYRIMPLRWRLIPQPPKQ